MRIENKFKRKVLGNLKFGKEKVKPSVSKPGVSYTYIDEALDQKLKDLSELYSYQSSSRVRGDVIVPAIGESTGRKWKL